MPHYALSELVLMICALWGVKSIFRLPSSLPAMIGLLLMAITAGIAVLRYGFSLQQELASLHGLYSSLTASVGMLLIVLSFISFKVPAMGQARWQWAAIAAVTMLFAAASIFQLNGPLVTISTLLAIVATIVGGSVLFNGSQRSLGLFTMTSGLLFLVVGSLVGSRGDDLFGLIPRWHIFHLTIALWCLGFSLTFKAITQCTLDSQINR